MLVAVAHGESPERLCAALTPELGDSAVLKAKRMAWGSLVLSDTLDASGERWLVAGRPQGDPWGLPLGDLSLDDVVVDFERYGARAAFMHSGPFVVVDLMTGRMHRAPNGIIPVFRARTSNGVVQATSERALRRLDSRAPDGPEIIQVPPGASAASCRVEPLAVGSTGERLSSLTWAGLDEELAVRVGRLGPRSRVQLAESDDANAPLDGWLSATSSGDVVFVPSLRDPRGRSAAFDATAVATLWSRARLGGRWLFAPTLERPLLDTAALVSGSGTTR